MTAVVPTRMATAADRECWNAFAFSHPQATFFHRHEWSEVLRRAFGHTAYFMLAEQNGTVVGILPLAHVRSMLFGNALVSTPFCVYGGIVAASTEAFNSLRDAACDLARRLNVDYLELRDRKRNHPDWPSKDLYYTFRRTLTADSEANMQAIPRKQRAMVRKGIQRNLQVRLDASVKDFYAMYSASLRNLGTPVFSRNYIEILHECFGSDAEILTITSDGADVSSVLSFRFREEILPYYGGGTAAARNIAANDFMYWQVMEHARQTGLALFDFGRSKRDSGAYSFKCNWGFEPEQLYYEYFLVRAKSMPDLSPVNPKYELMIRIWKQLPVAVANLIGPLVAKYLG